MLTTDTYWIATLQTRYGYETRTFDGALTRREVVERLRQEHATDDVLDIQKF
jgi:hypothetical protein